MGGGYICGFESLLGSELGWIIKLYINILKVEQIYSLILIGWFITRQVSVVGGGPSPYNWIYL